MTEGIDVSRYQASTPSLAGLTFLFAKASEGTTLDSRYGMHIANARKAGLVTGAYHFNYGPGSIAGQVAAFLAAAGDVDFYFVDVEGANAFTHAQTAAFIAGVQAAGKQCGLYHSESGFFDAGQDWNWVANWSHAPSVHWDFWQYHGGPLDLDRFNGTPDQLRALTTTEASVGIHLAPLGTTDSTPLDAFVKAKIAGAGHSIFRVFDGGRITVADGLDLGTVERAKFVAPLPTWANGNPDCVVFNYGTDGQHVAVIRDVVTTPLPVPPPPVDTTPFSQADLDAKAAAAAKTARGLALEQAHIAGSKGAGDAIDALPR